VADNVVSNPGAGGATFATDEDGSSVHHPLTKVEWGPLNTFNLVDDATGKRLPVKVAETVVTPVDDNGGSLTVDGAVTVSGTVAATQSGTWNVTTVTNTVHVDDNAASLTVDDGGGSLTVDGTVAATQSGAWGITGIVHVDDNAGSLTVDDGGSSLTVDGTVAATQSGPWDIGTITNVVHVDDNAGSLTIDGTVNQGGAPWSQNLTQVGGAAVGLGQQVMTASIPVVMASDHSPLPVNVSLDNAAQETGGNLDLLVAVTRGIAMQTELLQQVIVLLRGISLQLTDATGFSINDAVQAALTLH
jgi:hypothetical protein